MVQKVIWKTSARISLNQIVEFIRLQWPEEIVKRFLDLVDKKLSNLIQHPEPGMFSPFKGVRKSVIHDYVILYYKYFPEEEVIEFLAFRDPRQDPKKLKF